MLSRHPGRMEEWLQSLTSALGGGESSASCPGHCCWQKAPTSTECGAVWATEVSWMFWRKDNWCPLSIRPQICPCYTNMLVSMLFFFYFREINGMTVCFKCGPTVAPVNTPAAIQPSQLLYRYDCSLSVAVSNVQLQHATAVFK